MKKSRSSTTKRESGFTLVELLVGMIIGLIVVSSAGNLIVNTVKSRSNAEELRRKRDEWKLATNFIEAEIALAGQVITNSDEIDIPSECGILSREFSHAVVFPLERPMGIDDENSQVLAPAIYAIQSIKDGSAIAGQALVRCGPQVNDGEKNRGFYTSEICAKGQSRNCRQVILDNLSSREDCQKGFCISTPNCNSTSLQGQGLRFLLLANGLSTSQKSPYGQCLGTQSRVAPVYYYPDESSACNGSGNVNRRDLLYVTRDPSIEYSGTQPKLRLPQGAIKQDQQVVMCGDDFFYKVEGSSQNDIIESQSTDKNITLEGGDGNDRLLGGQGNDTLEGGQGDDILIGGPGADYLNGGSGKNSYLVHGNDQINGGQGVDIIFIRRPKSQVVINSCSKSTCRITDEDSYNGEPPFQALIKNGDVLIFLDGRKILN